MLPIVYPYLSETTSSLEEQYSCMEGGGGSFEALFTSHFIFLHFLECLHEFAFPGMSS